MIALVYVSFATHDMTDDELRDLLTVARQRNEAKNITGMLLYRDGFFIQALEGDEMAVMTVYNKIQRDKRHKNVLTVCKEWISERSFGAWSMGYNPISDEMVHSLPGFSEYLNDPHNIDFFARNPSHATQLLDSFKHRTYF